MRNKNVTPKVLMKSKTAVSSAIIIAPTITVKCNPKVTVYCNVSDNFL
jgi:hypothetical protein